MTDNTTFLRFQEVGFAYDAGNTALFRVNFAVSPGEVVLVAGANGSGKTTFLKLAGGFLPLSSGSILLDSVELEEVPEAKMEEWVAFVRTASEKSLVGPTVEDELARACRHVGLSGPAIPERVHQALEAVRLPEARKWYLDEMSVGELRRVALATALIGNPRIVLLDDPVAELDAAGVRTLSRVLRDLAQRGLTVLVSSHRLDASISLAQRVVILDQGELILDVSARELPAQADRLRKAGLALPQATEIIRQLQTRGLLGHGELPLTVEEAVDILAAHLGR